MTRIAMGMPVGSDLEYTDEITMGKAMEGGGRSEGMHNAKCRMKNAQ